jgi:predicted MFS family arabinose efflux permease
LWRAAVVVATAAARRNKVAWSSLGLGLSLGDIIGDSLGDILGDTLGEILAKYGASLRE